MTAPKRAAPADTGAPARNFTISTDDRVRAIAGGPPAYMRRKRAIEDLERTIVRLLVERCTEAVAQGIDAPTYARANAPTREFERLRDLVARHNRWYPIEADLPMHPRSGEVLDRTGAPWRPLPAPSFDDLIASAMRIFRADSGQSHVG